MLKVRVFCDGVLIGHSDLYASDPPMGVAIGGLLPTAAYEAVKDRLGRHSDGQIFLSVWVETANGLRVAGVARGAVVADWPTRQPTELPELRIFGIDWERYDAWFRSDPAYVRYYDKWGGLDS